MSSDNPHGIRTKKGRINMVNGTRCSQMECQDMGCVFPDCANYTGQTFPDEKTARARYPNLTITDA